MDAHPIAAKSTAKTSALNFCGSTFPPLLCLTFTVTRARVACARRGPPWVRLRTQCFIFIHLVCNQKRGN